MPYQGGPWGQPADEGSGGFFKSLFDFSFSRFITLTFAKIIFIILIVVAVLLWLTYIIVGFSTGEPAAGIAALLLGWIPAFLMIVFYRVALEMAVALVRTAQNTSALVEQNRRLVDRLENR